MVSRQKLFGINGNHGHKTAFRICQGAATPSFGPLDHVSCLGPLGAHPGVLDDPRVFINSRRSSIRIWVLLRLFCQEQFHRSSVCEIPTREINHTSAFWLCSSLRRQGLAFLARSTWSGTRLITRGAVVLRLQGSIFRSEVGSVCHSPSQ